VARRTSVVARADLAGNMLERAFGVPIVARDARR
jgi:hypothetical protein